MLNKFCPDPLLENPKCYTIETFDFQSEENIFDILLDLLKSELPPRMLKLKDCQDRPMVIAEADIDLIPSGNDSKFQLMLNPFSDVPSYSASLMHRTVKYTFELVLTVHNQLAECVTWELIRFKNAVEGLLIAAEFQIDGYNSVLVEPEGFRYFIPEGDAGIYRRQGAYRFSVTVTQYKLD